jgi:hypothetical protein
MDWPQEFVDPLLDTYHSVDSALTPQEITNYRKTHRRPHAKRRPDTSRLLARQHLSA